MESIRVTRTDAGILYIEGYPDAARVVRVQGELTRPLEDLALHREDLRFAADCIDLLNQHQRDWVVQQALWRSAVISYRKCFGGGIRFPLRMEVVYADRDLADVAYKYFKDLRDKHIAHDVNAFADAEIGAIINKRGSEKKVARIVLQSSIANTIEPVNMQNLRALVLHASTWVDAETDRICDALIARLEEQAHEALLARDRLEITFPGLEELSRSRRER